MLPDIPEILIARGYAPVRRIGRGAFAEVWLASREGDEDIGVQCAVKVLLPSGEQAADVAQHLFRQEAQLLSRLRHQNIVGVQHFFVEQGYPCLVMDYVEGLSLQQLLSFHRSHPEFTIPLEDSLELIAQAATGLHFAHSMPAKGSGSGLLHRDVKPANLMLTLTGQVQVLDFGIASLMEPGQRQAQSTIAGTPRYMAPEQARGESIVPATDLFALGLILFELVCLRPLNPGKDVMGALRWAQAYDPQEVLAPLREWFPAVGSLLEKLLSPYPQERFQRGNHLADALRKLMKTAPNTARLDLLCTNTYRQMSVIDNSGDDPSSDDDVDNALTFQTFVLKSGSFAPFVSDLSQATEVKNPEIPPTLQAQNLASQLHSEDKTEPLQSATFPEGTQARSPLIKPINKGDRTRMKPHLITGGVLGIVCLLFIVMMRWSSRDNISSINEAAVSHGTPIVSSSLTINAKDLSPTEPPMSELTPTGKKNAKIDTSPALRPKKAKMRLTQNKKTDKQVKRPTQVSDPSLPPPCETNYSMSASRYTGKVELQLWPIPAKVQIYCNNIALDLPTNLRRSIHLYPGQYNVQGIGNGADFSLAVKVRAGKTCVIKDQNHSPCPP